MTVVLIKKESLETDTSTQGEQHMNMKAENRITHLQAKDHQRLRANHQKPGERHGEDSPSQPSEGASTTMRQTISVILTIQLVAPFYRSPSKSIHICCIRYFGDRP